MGSPSSFPRTISVGAGLKPGPTGRNDIFLALFFLLSYLWASPLPAHDARPVALRGVQLEQKLGSQMPLDLEFRDEAGRTVRLKEYFGRRPVICPSSIIAARTFVPWCSRVWGKACAR